MLIALGVVLAILAYLWRFEVGLGRACYVVGCKTGGVGGWVGGSGFQDAIVPVWRAYFAISVWALTLLALLASSYFLGFRDSLIIAGVFIVASGLSHFFLVPKPESKIYLRIIARSVAKRTKELAREGDKDLAAMAEGVTKKMLALYPDRLTGIR